MTIEIRNATATQVIIDLASQRQDELKDASIQAATFAKYQDFQGYASEGNVERLLSFSSTIEITETYINSNEIVSARLNTMQSTVNKISDIAAEASQLIASRNNGATGSDVPLDVLGQSMLKDIAGQLNITFDGVYLFAGSKNTKPVNNILTSNLDDSDASMANYYSGNGDIASVKISDSQELEYGITADNEAFQQLIGAIHLAMEGHTEDDTTKIQAAMTMVNDAVERLGTVIANVGASRQIVTNATATHKSVVSLATENLTDITGGVDLLTEASIRIAELEATIQAIFSAFTRLNGLRLTNFI